MKSAVVFALGLTGAAAFMPVVPTVQRSVVMSAEGESRRAALAKTAGAFGLAFSGAGAAFADGAVSGATIARARGIYGGRILDLKDAVAKGDFAAVKAEKNAFVLFASGAYRGGGAIAKANKEKCIAATDAILAGIDAGDKAAVQKAYNDFLAVADIKPAYTGKDKDYTQGYSTEYDWKYKTNKGTIYIR